MGEEIAIPCLPAVALARGRSIILVRGGGIDDDDDQDCQSCRVRLAVEVAFAEETTVAVLASAFTSSWLILLPCAAELLGAGLRLAAATTAS